MKMTSDKQRPRSDGDGDDQVTEKSVENALKGHRQMLQPMMRVKVRITPKATKNDGAEWTRTNESECVGVVVVMPLGQRP